MAGRRRSERREQGQTLVEFSIALMPFLFLLMGVVDLGRGVHTNNGVSHAAREIARAASVHPCVGPCTPATLSDRIVETVNAQRALVPGLSADDVVIECTDVSDTVRTVPVKSQCPPGEYVRVTVTTSFRLVTPFLPVPNPFVVSATAHVQVP